MFPGYHIILDNSNLIGHDGMLSATHMRTLAGKCLNDPLECFEN